jgi:VWFA-related protein
MRCLALLCSGVASAQSPTGAQPPVFATQVDSVFIDAFVTHNGVNVTGLAARDFILKDNGARQPFDLVPADSLPIRAVLVFDTSSSMRGAKLERLRSAAQSFLEQLRPEDEAGLVSFSDEVAWRAPLTSDRSPVRNALATLKGNGATSVYDALFIALVVPRSALRTLVILFSDGDDNMSWLGETQMRRAVERSNALIHVVAIRSQDFESGMVLSRGAEAPYMKTLRELAEITGGSLIEAESPEGIGGAFKTIIEGMKSRYVLRYAPESAPAAGWHKLDLTLSSKKGKVRGRAGYWVESR